MRCLFTSFAASALALTAVCASAQSIDDVVATVNGTEITLGELLIARTQLPPQYQQMPAEALYEGLLTQMIQQELLSESITEQPKRLELAIKTEIRALIAGEALAQISSGAVTEEAITEAYNTSYLNTVGNQEFDASHILVETKEAADALIEELNEGADFAELAKEKSTGPSGPDGGALGWFGTGMMVPEFETAVRDLEPGDVSEPVETQFGWHVIRLNDVRTQEAPELDTVSGEIANTLRNEAIDAYLADLESNAEIEKVEDIDPQVITHTDLLAD